MRTGSFLTLPLMWEMLKTSVSVHVCEHVCVSMLCMCVCTCVSWECVCQCACAHEHVCMCMCQCACVSEHVLMSMCVYYLVHVWRESNLLLLLPTLTFASLSLSLGGWFSCSLGLEPQGSICLFPAPSTGITGTSHYAQLFHECWEQNLRPSYLSSKHSNH